MSTAFLHHPKAPEEQKASPAAGNLLQRKCACGTHTVAGGKCGACMQKSEGALGRSHAGHAHAGGVPRVVGEVLNSPGAALDAGTRSFMESKFGHDFSRVRVHSDARAAQSAEAVGAVAYTVGRDISFGPGRYAPETAEGRRLLAHELTHVLQQTGAAGGVASEAQAEREAEHNGLAVEAGQAGRAVSAAPAGLMQRQEKKKPEATVSGERTGEKGTKDEPAVKDQFTFKADVTVPLLGVGFGSLTFLNDLKLTPSYTASGPALGALPVTSDEFKLQMALTLAKLEISNLKNKADALKKGKLSFGTTLSTSGVSMLPFDPSKPLTSLGASLSAKAGATTPTLIPAPYGTFTLGSSLSATGSVTETFGPEGKTTPKAESKAGLSLDYKSPLTPNPYLTLGGLLGDKAQVTAGLEGTAAGSVTPDKTGGSLTGGASLGLLGKRDGVDTFIKLQITGTVSLDQPAGKAVTSTQSFFVGVVGGFEFSLPGETTKKKKRR